MRRRGIRALLLLLCLALPLSGGAIDVSVSAVVPSDDPPTPADTVVIFRGLAYTTSIITVTRQGSIIAAVPADAQARFDISLTGQPSGILTYSIQSQDLSGDDGPVTNITLAISVGTTTTVTGVFLGPTISVDTPTITTSQTVTLLGYTAPQSAVTLFVSSDTPLTYSITADGQGLWSKSLLGNDVGIGTHDARVRAVAPTQELSAFSNSASFSVSTAPTNPCSGKNRADINCDGRVNLTDLSILLFFWKRTNPSNQRVDINGDRVVNLTDVSILLFNFRR